MVKIQKKSALFRLLHADYYLTYALIVKEVL